MFSGPRLEIKGQNSIPVVERCTIGRHPSNTVVVDHKKVSRWHATIIRLSDREFRMMDFDTTNGTWLNGQRIKDPAVLANGDMIRIGPLEIRFVGELAAESVTRSGLATTIAETTTPIDLANADFEVTGHGIVAVDKKGRIRAMTEGARQWFNTFHDMKSDSDKLPEEIQEWLEQGIARMASDAEAGMGITPLRKKHGTNRLSIHLKSDRERRQTMLLVVHESPLFDATSLYAEFHEQFKLTQREAEVLYYVALGKTNQEIGTITECSHRTVEAHLRKVFPKIGVENRQGAIVFVPEYFRNKHRRDAES